MKTISHLCVLAGVLALGPASLRATPYASSVTNDAGTVRFVLNEDADAVSVTFDNGTATNLLGSLFKGSQSFSLGSATNFQILVSKTSGNGFVRQGTANSTFNGLVSPRGTLLQLSSDSNPLLSFNLPRGLTVNTHPNSPYFGRIYVANPTAGTVTSNTTARVLGDGVYVLNADQTDALAQGDTPLHGGLDGEFAAGGSASPYKLSIGQDDNLYIADWSDPNGTLFVTDQNLTVGSGKNVLPGLKGGSAGSTTTPVSVGLDRVHGSINQAVVEGSLEAGNLTVYTVDEDLQSDRTTTTWTQLNSLWRYDIGGTLPLAYDPGNPYELIMPTRLFTPSGRAGINSATQTMDVERGTSGHFYITDNRQNNGGTSGLIVRAPDGSAVWNSSSTTLSMTTSNTSDYCFDSYAVAVTADQKYVATLRRNSQCFLIPLTNNVPDLARRLVLLTFSSAFTARDVQFDVAGNLYVTTTSLQMMRIFSPGGATLAVTSGDTTGTNGTFRLVTLPVFRVHPASTYVDPGQPLSLVSYVEGLGEVTYQWQLNGTNIDGATNCVYEKIDFGPADTGPYTMVASNELGRITSTAAIVAVTPPPMLQTPAIIPPNQLVLAWSSVSNKTYRVQFNMDLNTVNWQDITDIRATNALSSITNDISNVDQRFYRVLRLP